MKTKPPSPTHEAIAARARQLWEEAGRPAGRDEEFWLRAEQQLRSESRPLASPPQCLPTIPQSPAHSVPPVIRDVVQVSGRPSTAKRKRAAR
jgi:hypothetical protein